MASPRPDFIPALNYRRSDAWASRRTSLVAPLPVHEQMNATLGLHWRKTGTTPPAKGQELVNEALATALQKKNNFSPEEWEEFGVQFLHRDHYITRVTSTFSQPLCATPLAEDT